MEQEVICPRCNKHKWTKANIFFRCCNRAWKIKECLSPDNDKLVRSSSKNEEKKTEVDTNGEIKRIEREIESFERN